MSEGFWIKLGWLACLAAAAGGVGCSEKSDDDGMPPAQRPAEDDQPTADSSPTPVPPLPFEAVEVPFSDLIHDVSGKQIIPVDPSDPVTAAFLTSLGNSLDAALDAMNAPDSPVKELRRINEASRFFEDAIHDHLNANGEFTAAVPLTAAGKAQRSGYPDLRVIHEPSGHVFYVDPKLYEETAETSSLRTFYFTPRRKTNKVLDDAVHVLIGISHDGNDGDWQFTGWKIVDLSKLVVRLKAEFQAANKDLYQPEAIVRSHYRKTEPLDQ